MRTINRMQSFLPQELVSRSHRRAPPRMFVAIGFRSPRKPCGSTLLWYRNLSEWQFANSDSFLSIGQRRARWITGSYRKSHIARWCRAFGPGPFSFWLGSKSACFCDIMWGQTDLWSSIGSFLLFEIGISSQVYSVDVCIYYDILKFSAVLLSSSRCFRFEILKFSVSSFHRLSFGWVQSRWGSGRQTKPSIWQVAAPFFAFYLAYFSVQPCLGSPPLCPCHHLPHHPCPTQLLPELGPQPQALALLPAPSPLLYLLPPPRHHHRLSSQLHSMIHWQPQPASYRHSFLHRW